MSKEVPLGRVTLSCERSDGVTVNVSFTDDASIDGYIESFKAFLIALGFHPDTVARGLNEDQA